jgi:L-aminopeptidase/D-esterase-like protein
VGQELADFPGAGALLRPNNGNDVGSIIVVLATNAPLLPHQLKRIARRAAMGVARTGGTASNSSGDIFVAFSTANSGAGSPDGIASLKMLANEHMTPLFQAAAEATEEAIINALVAADTMTGVNDHRAEALPHDQLVALLKKYHRLAQQ